MEIPDDKGGVGKFQGEGGLLQAPSLPFKANSVMQSASPRNASARL